MYKAIIENNSIPSTYGALAQAVCINEHYYRHSMRTGEVIREHNYTGIHFWIKDRARCMYSSSIRGDYSGCWYWDVDFAEGIFI